jgi:hypothetical protein
LINNTINSPFGYYSGDTQAAPRLTDISNINTKNNLFHGQTLNYHATENKWKNGYQVPCWKDLVGATNFKGSGSSIPPFKAYRGVIWKTGFNTTGNTIYYFNYHIPHDYIKGTDIFIHAHHSTTSATETGAFEFQLHASYAAVDDQFNDPIRAADITHTYTTSDQYRHTVSEIQLSTSGGSGSLLDTDLFDTDGLIFIRLRRQDTDTILFPDNLFLHQVDIHYQAYSGGTISKVAPFR